MHLTDTATLTLTEREVFVILNALSTYKHQLAREARADPADEGAKLDLAEAQALTRKIRDAP